ncbi:DUF1330 domain-containing protein [Nonomuraea dietziae]|uniref:DUF1330 domain-containing protein n=1 Tax=Nonomuraea dietziae TaxID=65515 RepID=UPI0033FDEC4D
MAAYALFDNIEVSDPDKLAEYASRVRAVVESYGGAYRAVGGQVDVLEGTAMLGYPVLIEFPDLQTAHQWYDSSDYRELKALRQAGSRANAIIFETAPSDLLNA